MVYRAPVWAEIDLRALAHNVRQLKNIANDGAELMAVVKANAYGHGTCQVARVALENGATQLGIARVSEGEELRRDGINNPILILGYTVPEDYASIIENKLTQTVYSLDVAKEISAAAARCGKKATVHIKIDTGMGRLGFCCNNESIQEIIAIARLPHLDVEGIFTHFAAADCQDKSYTKQQWLHFTGILEKLAKAGLEFPYKHAANSAALIELPETHLNLVRAGIALYGAYPSNEVDTNRVLLKPVMSVKSRVAHVKKVPGNTGISYGVTHVTNKETVVVTIPTGYADGYNRLLSSRGEVLLRGKRAPVIGRVCMDQFMVDAGHIPGVEPGEEAVLLGYQGSDVITADDIAQKIGTISYEVLCMISYRVPRFYV